jgi:uracil-DNA glycosylase
MTYFNPTIQQQVNDLLHLIETKRFNTPIFPEQSKILRALTMTPLSCVKVVIVGQDPYHQLGQADGLAFSSSKIPKSLANIVQELHTDIGGTPSSSGRLDGWAKQGVLLLNRILTVEEAKPLSHQHLGWQAITNHIIQTISKEKEFVVFVLWGAFAQEVEPLIDARHLIIKAPHPSPLSAYRGFFGHRPFSRINQALKERNISPIDWFSL